MSINKRIKILVVGDSDVGKTCLIKCYITSNDLDPNKTITIIENYQCFVKIDNEPMTICICDTAGQEDYDRLRPLAYNNETDIVIMCFSIFDMNSYDNVIKKWSKEIHHSLPGKPIILVGTKVDLRSDRELIVKMKSNRQAPICDKQAKLLQEEIKAKHYIECSSITKTGVKNVFDKAIQTVLSPENDKPHCNIL